ncbi:MAG: hypothetical protein GEU98_12180 [Pseudonocardiaceae bacterium]|nr:hypothetical protein [Pseudonocardiaceae bacterium]
MIRLRMLLAMLFPAALSAFPLAELLTAVLPVAGIAGPLSLATVLAASFAVVVFVCAEHARLDPGGTPARVRTIALRVRAWHAAFLRLRNPNAPGRARPRAPSVSVAAA